MNEKLKTNVCNTAFV